MDGVLRSKRLIEVGLESSGFGRWKCATIFIGEGVSDLQNKVRLQNDFKGFFYASIMPLRNEQNMIVAHGNKNVGYIENTRDAEPYEVHWEGTRFNGMDMKSTSCAFHIDTMLSQDQYKRLTECVLSEIDSSNSFVLVSDFSQKYSRNIHNMLAEKISRRGIAVSSILSMPERNHPEFYESRNDLRSLSRFESNITEVHRTSQFSFLATREPNAGGQKDKIVRTAGSLISAVRETKR